MSIKGHTRDERGHGVRLKVGPNVRIPGNWSTFFAIAPTRSNSSSVSRGKGCSGSTLEEMSNGTTVGHVGPGEDTASVCNREEVDTRIILHTIHALNCGFSSILIKTSLLRFIRYLHDHRFLPLWSDLGFQPVHIFCVLLVRLLCSRIQCVHCSTACLAYS